MEVKKATEKELQDIKLIMDVTKEELVKKMEKGKFRKKIFKNSKLFNKKEIEQAISDWDTLKYETKIDWFDSVLFKTKNEKGEETLKTYEEIWMIVNFLKTNKLNMGKTWRDLKQYGDIKKNNE